jgi:hypothetical protein
MPTNNAYVCIRAQISITGTSSSCDQLFADKRNLFRGVFDIRDIMASRNIEGTTTFTFFCDCRHDDAPIIMQMLHDAGFTSQYWTM